MSEQKTPTRPLSMKVFIRSNGKTTTTRRDAADSGSQKLPAHTPERIDASNFSYVAERERRSRQIKELVRLCGVVRADLSMDEVLQQIVRSMSACTGFRILVVNLLEQSGSSFYVSAVTGVSQGDERVLRSSPISCEEIEAVMHHSEFRISQSYYIPHERSHEVFLSRSEVLVTPLKVSDTVVQPGKWHPEDVLIVPLYSSHGQKMLGFLSLDDPEDGLAPTEEAIEVVELFANQAAIAIDNALLFQEREAERIALEQSIEELCREWSLVARGDLRVQVASTHPKLEPVARSINDTIEQINAIVCERQEMIEAIDSHMQSVHSSTESLAQDTQRQHRQIDTIANTINEFALMMHNISERAAHLSRTAVEAVEVTNDVQSKVDRVIKGMNNVRDATLHSARLMKLLGESGQQLSETSAPLNDLTTRMHLLSLNAAIEATRAGEQGQSFAVIAQEMRTLAMISTEATRQINNYIRTIQQEATQVAQSVEQSTQTVVTQSESVMLTGVSLDAMSEVTDQLTTLIQEICATAESQSQGSLQLMSAVNEVHRMTDEVTNHIEEMRGSVNSLVESSHSLRRKMVPIQLRQ
jgi:methyl-accepting chemotaxis protein